MYNSNNSEITHKPVKQLLFSQVYLSLLIILLFISSLTLYKEIVFVFGIGSASFLFCTLFIDTEKLAL